MNARQTRSTDAVLRTRKFVGIHADKLGPIATSAASHKLDQVADTVTGIITDQGSQSLVMLGQRGTEKALVETIRFHFMAPIAKFARASLKDVPDITALTRNGRTLDGLRLVHAARAMATTASAHLPQLVAAGFPESILQELEATANQLEETITTRGNTRTSRVAATRQIAQLLDEGREAIAILNAVIIRQFRNDPAFLASWNATQRIHAKVGAIRGGGSSADDAVTPIPPSVEAAA